MKVDSAATRKRITSITAVLLPFVTYLLSFRRTYLPRRNSVIIRL
jgi:hypothetical protein